jgi:hypothetical protein
MQRYTIFFIAVEALHVSAGFQPIIRSSKQAWHIPDAVCTIWAPDDGRNNRLKHVELRQQWRILYNVASCWLHLKEVFNDYEKN